jgi:hypothetical protein
MDAVLVIVGLIAINLAAIALLDLLCYRRGLTAAGPSRVAPGNRDGGGNQSGRQRRQRVRSRARP